MEIQENEGVCLSTKNCQRYIINFQYSYTIGCTGLSWLLCAFWHLSSFYGQ